MLRAASRVGVLKFPALALLCLIPLIAVAVEYLQRLQMKKSELRFAVLEPSSFDTTLFDSATHHVTQKAVFAALISKHQTGAVAPYLASKWVSSDDFRTWEFTIRDNLSFSNGDKLTSKDIKRTLTRMAFLMRSRGSNSGLLEKIEGYEDVNQLPDNYRGIQIDTNTITFRLKESLPDFLDRISFGLYSVVHESDYDPTTGAWEDPKSAISSGPYQLESWTPDGLKVTLRPDFDSAIFKNEKFQSIMFVWKPDAKADIYYSDSLTPPSNQNQKLKFFGGPKNGIYYVKVASWKVQSGPLARVVDRNLLRNAFYRHLDLAGFQSTKSFLPLEIPNVAEFQTSDSISDPETSEPMDLRILDWRFRGGFRKTVAESLFTASNDVGFTPSFASFSMEAFQTHLDTDRESYPFDITGALTAILIAQPDNDLRFMVESKEGIRLPDPTGELGRIVKADKIDYQKFNQVLWDDAIVWPVTHFSNGLWFDDSVVSMSLISPAEPPTEVALIQPR